MYYCIIRNNKDNEFIYKIPFFRIYPSEKYPDSVVQILSSTLLSLMKQSEEGNP